MKEFKVEFYRDKTQDKNDTYEFFENSDPAGWLNRAIGIGVPLFLVNDITHNKKGAKQNLFDHMDKEYEIFEEYDLYKSAQEQTDKFWKKIEKDFSKRVSLITNRDMDSYKCLLTLYITTAAWNENITIRRNIKELQQDRFLIAFELLLSHTFKCVRDFYSEEDIKSDWDTWGLAEITASFMLRDEEINSLFPELNFPLEKNWFIGTNYPFLEEYEDVLKKYWAERKSFKQYIDKSIEYINNNHIKFG